MMAQLTTTQSINMKYLPVNVFRSSLGDCTNGGVTADDDSLFVVPCEDGFLTDEGLADRHNVVILEPAEIMGSLYFKPSTITGHSMAGGNFVYTSDSRFSRTYSKQPVRVHDRVE